MTILAEKFSNYRLLEKFLTRDSPLIAREYWWYRGFTFSFKELFGFGFPKIIFIKRGDTFSAYWDKESVVSDTVAKIGGWFQEDSGRAEIIHRRLIEGLQYFRKARTVKSLSVEALFDMLDTTKEYYVQGTPAVFVVHWLPIFHDQFIQNGRKVFDTGLIGKLKLWREQEGNIFSGEGVETFYFLLDAIERKMGWEKDSLKYITYQELREVLIYKKSIPVDVLKRRREFVFAFIDGEVVFESDIDGTLEKLGYQIKREAIPDDIKEVKGVTGNRGYGKGTVRIVFSREQINSVEDKDILVAPMTSPWYLPAMKKASAFVTDEGGITCHAAIIAREMNKPCVIGTKIATQALKDGDLVEVDADKGVVRILERRE